jgi:putative lipoic acid-binding regulatory protein
VSESTGSLLQFPCDFPVKVFGNAEADFAEAVLAMVRKHAPGTAERAVSVRPSSGGKYSAVTVVVRAESQMQLDEIYRELTGSPRVKMAL